ncbi:MAG TPA: DoxX family protein [Chitinophagales bacterium]
MKATKITYYATTGLMSFAMAFSTYAYLTKPELKAAFEHLGFPDYFRIELAIAKLFAAIALWLPFRLAKETAYIGLTISFVSAIIAHIAVGDPFLPPVIVLAILIVSYITYLKTSNN